MHRSKKLSFDYFVGELLKKRRHIKAKGLLSSDLLPDRI